MPSLFMIQFAVPSDRSFVLISCCFALGSFSGMIFILSFATSFARRQKGGGWSTTGHCAFAFFWRGQGGDHWHVIYKIKSIKDLSRGVINGTRCVTWEHKGSLTGRRGGVCYIKWAGSLRRLCGPFIFLLQGLIKRLRWSLQSEWGTMHTKCLELVLSPPSSDLATDLCLGREAGLGQNTWLPQKQHN